MSAWSTRRPAASRSKGSAIRSNLALPAPQALQLAPVALGRPALAPLVAHRLDELALLGQLLARRAARLGLLVQLRRLGRAHAPRDRAAHDHFGPLGADAQLDPVARAHLARRLRRLPVDLHASGLHGVGGERAGLRQPDDPEPVIEPVVLHLIESCRSPAAAWAGRSAPARTRAGGARRRTARTRPR